MERCEEEHAEQTRARLLSAGLDLLAQRGFRGATSREIARVAGVSEVTLYRHFRSKDDLFAAAMTQQMQALLALAPQASGNLEDDLLAFAQQYYNHLTSHRVRLMRIIPELRRYGKSYPSVEEISREFQARLFAFFHHYQHTGALSSELGDHIAAAFMGPMYYYLSRECVEETAEFDCRQFVRFFLNGYRQTDGIR
jgi:AcrR family transcriptional regulator